MKKNMNFSIKFWGVRGSHPVPSEITNRYGGNTSCVEVRASDHIIIFDSGTGIISLGSELTRQARKTGIPIKATIFFSHLHHDHTQGLPFFAPVYSPTSKLNFFVPDMYDRDPKKVLSEVMSNPVFPISFKQTQAEKQIHCLRQSQIVVLSEVGLVLCDTSNSQLTEDAVILKAMLSHAHPQGVMIFRIEYQGKSVVYATDTECYMGGDQRLVEFAYGADLLIHDAQYTQDHYLGALAGAPVTQGYGHSTVVMACDTARAAEVGQLVLFHHDPTYDDRAIASIERQARKLFTNSVAAREGQIINLGKRTSKARITETLPLAKTRQQEQPAVSWTNT